MTENDMKNTRPYVGFILETIEPRHARKYALTAFMNQLGHNYVDIPMVTDAKGLSEFSRYLLKDFLKELLYSDDHREQLEEVGKR